MRPRQNARADRDRPDRTRVATVDSWLAGQDAAAYDARFGGGNHVAHRVGVRGVVTGGQDLDGVGGDLLDALAA